MSQIPESFLLDLSCIEPQKSSQISSGTLNILNKITNKIPKITSLPDPSPFLSKETKVKEIIKEFSNSPIANPNDLKISPENQIKDFSNPNNMIFEKSFISIKNSQNIEVPLDYWNEYFYDDPPKNGNNDEDYRIIIIRTIYQFFLIEETHNLLMWGQEKRFGLIDCYIDYTNLRNFFNSKKTDSDFFEILLEILGYLENCPSDLLHSFDLALDSFRTNVLKKPRRRVITRIINLNNLLNMIEIKSNIIGKYIGIKGVVLKTSPIKLLCKSMQFLCMECKKTFQKKFIDGIYVVPTQCEKNEKCKSKAFQPDKTNAETILYQRVKIQEIDEESGSGRMPRNIDCELKENLVNSVISGETIIINGILKTESFEENKGKNQQGLYNMYLDVNSIINCKDNQKAIMNDEEYFTSDELKKIENLSFFASKNQLLPLLIRSFCPSIYGHELVKAGLLLAMLGGSSKINQKSNGRNSFSSKNYKNSQSFRSDCHVLLIGDPGLGKSQLLKFVANIAPRSVYICGKGSSTVGLTVAVSKDGVNGEGSLEAGALVLSDQGICCIDEFDKMEKEHLALLESMEQQSVSIAKSGVLCSLQTRTSIFASANPVGGNYNKQKNVKENIKISNAILSRFDLIFLMLDEPDPKRDQKLSEHVMKLHNFRKRSRNNFENSRKDEIFSYSQFQNNYNDYNYNKLFNHTNQGEINKINKEERYFSEHDSEIFQGNRYLSLSEKLLKQCETIEKILQPQILRKYIAYVKKNYHPHLSKEASDVLKNFFMKLRENSDTFSTIPITTRQLESLIRLSQARARLDFRNEEIVELMQESLFDALEDISCSQIKAINSKSIRVINKSNVGGLSVPKQTKIFIEKLNDEAESKKNDLFEYQELLKIAKGLNMSLGNDFSNYIEKLNSENFLILKGNKSYQLVKKREF